MRRDFRPAPDTSSVVQLDRDDRSMIPLAALFQSKTGGRMLLRGTLRVVSVLVLMAVSGFAQSDRGAIRGTISDTSGAVIPESKVTALNLATGVTSSTVSTGAGVY